MTRVELDGVGYTEASALLADGNRWAAVAVDTLSDTLSGSGAMAGDSSFAGDFAAAYDEAAAAAVAGFDDVVAALGSLARLAYCSFENHARAENASILSTVIISTEPEPMSEALYVATSPAPPSSLGGDASFLPGWANVILDHIEGFVWPDADVDRLRSTAAAWRTASGELQDAAGFVYRADAKIYQLRSPEVAVAVRVLGDTATSIQDLADVCHQLGTVCDDYATAVEEQRELILDLVRDLIRDAVLIAAAGFLLGIVTGGSANAVAAWINGGKLAAHVPRFKAFVETLRLYAAGAAAGLRTTSATVVRVRGDLARFVQARRVYMGERGAIGFGGKTPTFLSRHEGGVLDGHTLRKHVGKTDAFLRRRLARERGKPMVSTFTDEPTAEAAIRHMLTRFGPDIDSWLASGRAKLALNEEMASPVGRVMHRGGPTEPGHRVRMVLAKDSSMPDGYRILTTMVFP